MKSIKNRTIVISTGVTAMLGLALIGLASCSSGDSATPSRHVTTAARRCQALGVRTHFLTEKTTSVVA